MIDKPVLEKDEKLNTGNNMFARIYWIDNVLFQAETGSGHSVIMDGPPQFGGANMGIRPMEMVLSGLGGCSAFDVIHILKKSRQPVSNCIVELNAQRANQDPKVFTHIHVHYIVSGEGLKEAAVQRAVKLSAEKYCSVSLMLGKTVNITYEVEIKQVESE